MKQSTIYFYDIANHGYETYIEMRQAVTAVGRYAYRFDLIRKGNVIADGMEIYELREMRDIIDNAIKSHERLAIDIDVTEDDSEQEEPDHE